MQLSFHRCYYTVSTTHPSRLMQLRLTVDSSNLLPRSRRKHHALHPSLCRGVLTPMEDYEYDARHHERGHYISLRLPMLLVGKCDGGRIVDPRRVSHENRQRHGRRHFYHGNVHQKALLFTRRGQHRATDEY